MMTEQTLGTTTITQVGIIVQDIEAKARAWATASSKTDLRVALSAKAANSAAIDGERFK